MSIPRILFRKGCFIFEEGVFLELITLSEGVHIVPCPSNVGVIECGGGSVVLVDSGLDDRQIKSALTVLREHSMTPVAVIITHAHSDHFGGGSYLKASFPSLRIYSFEGEAGLLSNPYNQAMLMFGGAAPARCLNNRLFMPKPCRADIVLEYKEQTLRIGEAEIKTLPLPGHTMFHCGVSAGGILFCADSLMSPEETEKLGLPLVVDYGAQENTLSRLRACDYRVYVTAHCPPMSDPGPSIDAMEKSMQRALNGLEALIEDGPRPIYMLQSLLMDKLSVRFDGINDFFLHTHSVYAAADRLCRLGRAELVFNGKEPQLRRR